MTIAAPSPRLHSPFAEGLRPHRGRRRFIELEGHAVNQMDVTEPDRLNGCAASAIAFGPFRLLAGERLLLDGDRPVRLGSRALDILIALVERPGELVSKQELMAVVWPETVVVEANLTVHVAALRRALGDGRAGNRYIVNVPGRGYRFVTPVTFVDGQRSITPRLATTVRPLNLPVQLTRLIGRAEIVNKLEQQLPAQRLLTIVGPGGIGKTAVALDVARRLMGAFEDGVWLIDLAPIAEPRLVPTALASSLRLEIRSDNPIPGLIDALSSKQMLLVFDNCEHVIEAAAGLADGILKGSRGVQILATSREPLRLEGERVHRLPPLESPPASARLSAAEALRFAAVQLFVERAAAAMSDFALSDAEAKSAGDICRRLDGVPLAIELAAARVDTLGIGGLAARLDDRLRLLTGGRRAVLPRHQTICAALDWSYQLLGQDEQTVFRRLAIFVGGFTIESARDVTADPEGDASDIADSVASLVMKSLITVDGGDGAVRFRLLETTRAYALSKLLESGEADALARRHAAYFRDLVDTARIRWIGDPSIAAYAPEIDNIRAALTWAFAPWGDPLIAVELAAASAPIWLDMSLLSECQDWTGRALDILDARARGTRREMVLQTALGVSLMFTPHMSSRARAALTRAIELAKGLRDLDYQQRALAGLTLISARLEDFRGAVALARQVEATANVTADAADILTANSLLSYSHFFLGELALASAYARRALRRITPVARRTMSPCGLDHSIKARCVLARVLWDQGLLDQSAQIAQDVVADAASGGHAVSLGFALTSCGGPISLGRGDLEAAERSIAWLKDHAEKHGLSSYYACGLGFEGQLSAKRGDVAGAERLLRAGLDGLREGQFEVHYTPFLSRLAEILAKAGRRDEGLDLADEALRRTESKRGFWWMPEALRIKGEVLLLSHWPDASFAEDHFRRSLELARRKGALLSELRAALSLARLRDAQGSVDDACGLLISVYARFTEGFEAIDLRYARKLLEQWSSLRTTSASEKRTNMSKSQSPLQHDLP